MTPKERSETLEKAWNLLFSVAWDDDWEPLAQAHPELASSLTSAVHHTSKLLTQLKEVKAQDHAES